MSEYLTLNEVTDLVGFPLNSVKRYLEAHAEFLDFHKKHNRFVIHVSAVDTLKTIRSQYGQGKRFDDVNAFLKSSSIPIVITVPDESETVDGNYLINLNEEIQSIKELLKYQSLQNENLHKELLAMKHEFNMRDAESLSQLRDGMESVKDSIEETVKETAVSLESSRGFWSRLFKGN